MKKIRYGVIGINGIGELHCRFVRANMQTELTSLVDRDQESVEQKAKEFGVKSFTDYRQMIEAGVVDAVSIATPHFLHAVIGLDCLKAGIHVFMEKPFACRVSEADEMIRVARENGLKICVGHQYRLHRTSKTMKHLVDSDTLGKIIRVLWTWGVFRPGKYFSRDIWRSTWEHAGGGVLMTHAIHDLDLLCWLFGRPVSVNAMLGNQLHDIAGEDIACANILFENSVAVSFQATLNQPEAYSVRQIAGDRGIMVIQDLKSTTFDHKDRIQVGHYQSDLR
ncbi:MAG: Gfo/Idh/MocA family oxidoreductase, partial [Desulfobulbaceae bacterium]|nr:Gfo/Idh/MocA family oxidoreductase [Desulfobulbaceae bacterium]